MSTRDSKYIHGTEPDEQQRLSTLNDILNERALHGTDIYLSDRIRRLESVTECCLPAIALSQKGLP
ncbi:MAG: hypothetical protein IH969_09870 [Candidatus Krumholzibacteriota bacterium]|nr:hypothetical protein [Candidatus Krumholzibacteriota bacterium]